MLHAGRRGGRAGRRQGGVHDRPADDLPVATAAGPPSSAGRRWASTGKPRAAPATTTCSARSASGSTRAWPGMKPTQAGLRGDRVQAADRRGRQARHRRRRRMTRSAARSSRPGAGPRAASRWTSPSRRTPPAACTCPAPIRRRSARSAVRHAADRRQRSGRQARRRPGRPRRLRRRLGLATPSGSARASSPPPRSPAPSAARCRRRSRSRSARPASFGAFTPGVGEGLLRVHDGERDLAPPVTRRCRVADPSRTATGHWSTAAFALPQPLQARVGRGPRRCRPLRPGAPRSPTTR